MRTPTQGEYEDKNILKTKLTAEDPPWDPPPPEFSRLEQSIDCRGQFVSPNIPARGQLFINSVTLYAYDAAEVINDESSL